MVFHIYFAIYFMPSSMLSWYKKKAVLWNGLRMRDVHVTMSQKLEIFR